MSVEIPFFSQTAVLDQYIHSANPVENEEVLPIIIGVLRTNPELRQWFFSHRPHPIWTVILLAAGFLDESPAPIETPRGHMLKKWDAQEYLISVAGQVPEVVLMHFDRLKGLPFYFERAIYALRQIPMSFASKAVPSLLSKLADPAFARAVGEETFELMTAMAKEDFTEKAFDLFGALTVPQPAPNALEFEGFPGEFYNAEVISLLPTKEYDQGRLWRKGVKELARLDLERLVAELERLLLLALRIEAETGQRDETLERSSYWRNAIGDTSQDSSDDYKDLLMELLRDNLELLVVHKLDIAMQFVNRYLSQDFEILRRLGLYLLWRFPAQFSIQVKGELLNPNNLDDRGIHHEYFKLLQHGYPQLDQPDKERLERMILAGPGAERLKEVAGWANKDLSEDPEEYARGYSKHWVQKRLWMIRESLAGEAAAELQHLTAELGEPDHPEFTRWVSGMRTISPVSPVSVNELREMSHESLIDYLRDWKPSVRDYSRGVEESFGALGWVVAEATLSDLGRYGDLIFEIARLRPAYATNLINYFFVGVIEPDAVRQARLSLIERLLEDETVRCDMSRNDGAGWAAFRYAAVTFAKKLLEREEWQVPPDELSRIRDILIILVDDPDPDVDSDQPQEGWVGHKDPATVAINHVRPEALSTLIYYVWYVARPNESENQKSFGPKRLDPLVEQTLSRKVNWSNDHSLSLHSIYGKHLNLLCWLDWEWVRAHLDDIFPEGDDGISAAFFAAAWDSFVGFNRDTYTPVFDLLRSKYETAINRLKNGYTTKTHLDPVEHFAYHLMVEYLHAEYDLYSADGQRSLIVKFFNEAAAEARGKAAWMIARTYQASRNDEHVIVEYWRRIRALWQWRLDEAARMDFSDDFESEMEGFSGLLNRLPSQEDIASMWPLLQGLLHYIGCAEHRDVIWRNIEEYLSREVKRDPIRAIQIFRLMHDQQKQPLSYYSKNARKILEIGAERKESRSETLLMLEKIARSGHYYFSQIYEMYATLSGKE
jgi:hypothetical protein